MNTVQRGTFEVQLKDKISDSLYSILGVTFEGQK